MASAAQIAANRNNAARSTGPRTPEGKARAAANAISFGLFNVRDFVAPGEDAEYAQFVAAWRSHLSPTGPAEEAFAIEITRAAWRLRRCALVESELGDHDLAANPQPSADHIDPMLDPETQPLQNALDRAHLNAHNKLRRSIAELRRLQTENHFRAGAFPDDTDHELGLTDCRDLAKDFAARSRHQMTERRLNQLATIEDVIEATIPKPAEDWLRSAENQNVGRNAPCPCGSGQKFKRCCGRGAPPIINPGLSDGARI
jgi:hypothetical protein